MIIAPCGRVFMRNQLMNAWHTAPANAIAKENETSNRNQAICLHIGGYAVKSTVLLFALARARDSNIQLSCAKYHICVLNDLNNTIKCNLIAEHWVIYGRMIFAPNVCVCAWPVECTEHTESVVYFNGGGDGKAKVWMCDDPKALFRFFRNRNNIPKALTDLSQALHSLNRTPFNQNLKHIRGIVGATGVTEFFEKLLVENLISDRQAHLAELCRIGGRLNQPMTDGGAIALLQTTEWQLKCVQRGEALREFLEIFLGQRIQEHAPEFQGAQVFETGKCVNQLFVESQEWETQLFDGPQARHKRFDVQMRINEIQAEFQFSQTMQSVDVTEIREDFRILPESSLTQHQIEFEAFQIWQLIANVE